VKICQLCAVDFTLKKFLLPLIDGLVANGDDVISVCSSGEYVQEMRAAGYQVDTIYISRSLHPLKHLVSIWKMYRYFQRESFDVVHVHTPVAALVGRIAAHFARVPCVIYTAHGFYFHDRMPSLKKWVHVTLERVAGRMTDLLFTQSNEDAVTARELKIMPNDRIFAIGNGVNPTRFDPARHNEISRTRKSLGIPEGAYVVGMVGRQVEEKGVVEFLKRRNN
jgi:glycosyltransferase involved in cell wall biosynthesis